MTGRDVVYGIMLSIILVLLGRLLYKSEIEVANLKKDQATLYSQIYAVYKQERELEEILRAHMVAVSVHPEPQK